jgi:C-terminal processing protease CtpA/Prc
VEPIPLAQAMDGVFNQDNTCVYFVRFAQSSNTIRYVGGTAESLWAWCRERDSAVALTTAYRGTDKQPSIVQVNDKKYLFFLSDRLKNVQNSEPGSMNLWAMPLLSEKDLYDKSNSTNKVKFTQLTQVSCEFDGKPLVEYSVDSITGNVVLRIGADLHLLKAQTIHDKLSNDNQKKNDKDPNKRKLKETKGTISKLPITVFSDFHEQQERLIPVSVPGDVTTVDVYQTAFGGTSALLGLRGQLFVTPVIDETEKVPEYAGAGMNLPRRRYRVAPGIGAGGSVRIQAAKYVPLLMEKDARRLALVLATDPKSETAEHAFYLLETQSDAPQMFVDVQKLPDPFLGGSKNGGSVADGGLGTVNADSVSVSPCGRRFAWTDLDGRICIMTMPMYQNDTKYQVLAQQNEQGQPMIGTEADLSWSPGGRYLAIKHAARNQFDVISIADIGDPEEGKVNVGRIVQATSDRFNSGSMYWGRTPLDFNLKKQQEVLSQLLGKPLMWSDGASVLYYLSDRDLVADVKSPWGTRQPSPHFPKRFNVYALPLVQDEEQRSPLSTTRGPFGGGGASELWVDNILALQQFLEAAAEQAKQPTRHLLEAAEKDTKKDVKKKSDLSTSPENENIEKLSAGLEKDATPEALADTETPSPFPQDREIDFGMSQDLSFARRAYRLGNIPEGQYAALFQPMDDPSIGVIESAGGKSVIKIFSAADFPSDAMEPLAVELETHQLAAFSFTTTRKYMVFFFSPGNVMKVVPNSAAGLVSLIQDKKVTKNIADTNELALSVWPSLEYQQMYDDAWRMLRDYFYDSNMHGVDWPLVHSRYRQMVKRCAKREELDDVLKQMAAELSALHVFVYGGEYGSPLHDDKVLDFVHETSSLGATMMRSAEWKGYVVTSIPERDPDFNLVDGKPIYSPLSNTTLELTGQRGLQVGDVIVAINGESVMRVPDIYMLLRGQKGRSVRLEVLRLASGTNIASTRRMLDTKNETKSKTNKKMDEIAVIPEPLVTVPISLDNAADLSYSAWEYKTRTTAHELAQNAGFTLGYIHLRSMSGPNDIDSFFRDFYPNYNKQALIVDVRHNRGGNIDSWLLDILQRRAWMYWQSRTMNITTGGLGWDEQFAFRGHLVVLINEHTASDGEGFSRGVVELGLGKLIGKRTWGGGIWLSSDNHLVDGGIATAPEVGTYNDKFGWGLGIEQMGVEPNVEVDNDPHKTFLGQDQQLEYAIQFLQKWIHEEPVVLPKNPGPHPDRSIDESCNSV